MQLKRNIGATKAPLSNISPVTPPPIPTKPMNVSTPAAPPTPPPNPSSEKTSPFRNVSFGKSSKLVALEASGSNAYVLVSSPTVCVILKKGRPLFYFLCSIQMFMLWHL